MRRDRITSVNAAFYTTEIVNVWQGIRELGHHQNYIIAGTSGNSGIVYIGPLNALSQSIYPVNFPGATSTSAYGPDVPNSTKARIRLVGVYRNNTTPTIPTTPVFGFLFSGTVDELSDSSKFTTIVNYSNSQFTYAQSISHDLVVGTSDNPSQYNTFNLNLGPVNAFVYNIRTGRKDAIVFPNSVSNTANGIWHNGGDCYTICGSHSTVATSITSAYSFIDGIAQLGVIPASRAYLVDYNSRTRKFTNWTTFDYPEANIATSFSGISATKGRPCRYQVSANSAADNDLTVSQGSWVEIERKRDCRDNSKFHVRKWVDVNYPEGGINAATSVAGEAVVGIAELEDTDFIPYQAQLLVKDIERDQCCHRNGFRSWSR